MTIASSRSVAAVLRPERSCSMVFTLLLATWVLMFTWQPSLGADGEVHPTSFIAPLERDRPYRLVVIGDSVGANLADGLRWTFRRGRNVKVRKQTKAGTGFVRTDVYNWQRVIRRLARRRKADIIVMLIGGNDRQDMRVRGRRHERFSKSWRIEYVKRLETAARMLRKSGAAVYWVGLPNVRSRRMSRDYTRFNADYERVSQRYGLKYIDIRHLFVTRNGGYSDYGKNLDGRRVRLRDRDGIHMSNSGSKLLGRYIADHIENDMPRKGNRSANAGSTTRFVRKRISQ